MKYVVTEELLNEMIDAIVELPFLRVAELMDRIHNETLPIVEEVRNTEPVDVDFTPVVAVVTPETATAEAAPY